MECFVEKSGRQENNGGVFAKPRFQPWWPIRRKESALSHCKVTLHPTCISTTTFIFKLISDLRFFAPPVFSNSIFLFYLQLWLPTFSTKSVSKVWVCAFNYLIIERLYHNLCNVKRNLAHPNKRKLTGLNIKICVKVTRYYYVFVTTKKHINNK